MKKYEVFGCLNKLVWILGVERGVEAGWIPACHEIFLVSVTIMRIEIARSGGGEPLHKSCGCCGKSCVP